MSKGSPIIKTRIKPLLLARVEAYLRERETTDHLPPWTVSDFIIESILFYFKEKDRKKKYTKTKKLSAVEKRLAEFAGQL